MNFEGISLFLVILAFCGAASAFAKPAAPLGEMQDEILKQGLENFPDFVEPSEKEWIEFIKGTLAGNAPPDVFQMQNYTLQINETGLLQTTKGVKGTWNLTANEYFGVGKEGGYRRVATAEYMMIDGVHYAKGTSSFISATSLTKDVFGIAKAYSHSLFIWHKDDIFQLVEMLQGAGTGVMASNTPQDFLYAISQSSLANRTKDYSVHSANLDVKITTGKHNNTFTGSKGEEILPLSNFTDNNAMLQILSNLRLATEPTAMNTKFTGNFTNGKTGSYHMESHSVSINLKTSDTFNITQVSNGKYKSYGPQMDGQSVPAHEMGLLEVISRNFF